MSGWYLGSPPLWQAQVFEHDMGKRVSVKAHRVEIWATTPSLEGAHSTKNQNRDVESVMKHSGWASKADANRIQPRQEG